MTWQYQILPDEGCFPEEALLEWVAFLERVPSRRRRNGSFQLFPSFAERDLFEREVVAVSGIDMNEAADHVGFTRDAVLYNVCGKSLDRKMLSQFLKSFHERWPCKIFTEAGARQTIDQFCKFATRDPASS
jgi:hypothetical protein